MKALFPDWRAQGVTSCLHEHQGGFAFNMDSVHGLLGKAERRGRAVLSGVEVKAFEPGAGRIGRGGRDRPGTRSRSASRS